MPRIRSIKPSFFRHEGLQDLEVKHKGKYPMFVFAGLWGHCDKLGRFRWVPRQLKLDILPFLPFDMEATLTILLQGGYLKQYELDGKVYGCIPTFIDHQRINGKEAQDPPEYPDPVEFTSENTVKQQGSDGEAVGKQLGRQEGKGTGREEEQEGNTLARAALSVSDVVEVWNSIKGLPMAKEVQGPIKQRIQVRIKEHQELVWFKELFERVSRSDFLAGRKTDFTATLDWVLSPKNLAKILNGNYDNRESSGLQAPVIQMAKIPPFPGPEDPIGRSLWRKAYGNPV